jgi:hypothetical protein
MPLTSAQTATALAAQPTQNARPTQVTIHLEFDGVDFVPSALHTILDAQYPVVASIDNSLRQGHYRFRITAS